MQSHTKKWKDLKEVSTQPPKNWRGYLNPILDSLLSLYHNLFLNPNNLERKEKSSKNSTCNNSNLIREAKEADEVCSSLGGLGVQSFQPDQYGITHQSDAEPPGRGLKIEAFERNTNDQAGRKKRNGRISHRLLRALNGCVLQHAKSQDMNTTTLKDLVMKQEQKIQLFKESRMEQLNTGSIPMAVESQAQLWMRLIPIRKNASAAEANNTFIETVGSSKEATVFLISKANRKIRLNKIFCNKNGNMYKKKKMELKSRFDGNLGLKNYYKNSWMGARNLPAAPNILINSEELEALYS